MSYKSRELQGLGLPPQIDRANPPIPNLQTPEQQENWKALTQLGFASLISAQLLAPEEIKTALSGVLLSASVYSFARSLGIDRMKSMEFSLGLSIVPLVMKNGPDIPGFITTLISCPVGSGIAMIIDRSIFRRGQHAQFDLVPSNA